jgi:Ca-activated chloride channel family protein
MQWEKLDRSFQALEPRARCPADRFQLLMFNTEVAPLSPARSRRPATSSRRWPSCAGGCAALFFRRTRAALARGGAGAVIYPPGRRDAPRYPQRPPGGVARRGGSNFRGRRPRTYVYAVGDDANLNLLRMLARNDGLAEWVRSTEPAEFKLNSFVSKIGRRPIEQLRLSAAPEASFDMVYPLADTTFAGSLAAWVGQYRQPAPAATFSVSGVRDGQPLAHGDCAAR